MEIQYSSGLLGSVRDVYAQGRLENSGERQHAATSHAAAMSHPHSGAAAVIACPMRPLDPLSKILTAII